MQDATPSPEVSTERARKVMLLAGSSTLCMVLGVSSIIPLLPMLAEKFSVSLPEASLLITVFTLPGIIFTPLAGFFIDRFGRKAVLIPSLLVFGLAGSACALAPNFTALVFLRFLQGTGAASLGILNTTLIGDTFNGLRMSRMIGYNMSLLNVCTALYPALSGFLAEIDWRLPFLLPLISLPATLVALRTPLPFSPEKTTISGYVKRVVRAVKKPAIMGMLVVTLLTFTLLYGPIITAFPILAHKKFAADPSTIGSMMMLFSIGSGLMASQMGRFSIRFSTRQLIVSSQCLYIIGLTFIPLMSSLWLVLPFILIYGLGQGLNIPNIQAGLLLSATGKERASVMAMNGMLLRIGQTIAPLMFSTLAHWGGPEAPFRAAILLPVILIILALRLVPNRVPNAKP